MGEDWSSMKMPLPGADSAKAVGGFKGPISGGTASRSGWRGPTRAEVVAPATEVARTGFPLGSASGWGLASGRGLHRSPRMSRICPERTYIQS